MCSAPDDARPTSALRGRVEHALDQPSTAWVSPDTGLSAAARYAVTLKDGSSVFVKAATDDQTERWLRNEYLALGHVPERFGPRVVAWLDDPGDHPVLVVEDLRHAHWPAGHEGVDWREGDIERVLAAVTDLSGVPGPAAFEPSTRRPAYWPTLLAEGPDRAAFLDLGLASPGWLADAASVLAEAEAGFDESGDSLVHGDLRSDNICVTGERVVFVDWSHASRGSADHDLALLLPTLHLEGGPMPYDVMPEAGGWAAAGAASLARRVLDDHGAPDWLVSVFVRLIAIDLAWAASCLGIPRPDGIDWRAI